MKYLIVALLVSLTGVVHADEESVRKVEERIQVLEMEMGQRKAEAELAQVEARIKAIDADVNRPWNPHYQPRPEGGMERKNLDRLER